MNCTDITDLLPAYILDALEPSEADAVDAHLMTCREHDEDLVGLRSTGLALALLAEPDVPSPALRERVLAIGGPRPLRLDDRPELDEGSTPPAPPVRRAAPAPRWRAWALGAAAAVLLSAGLFGGGWYVGQRAAPRVQTVRYSYEMRGTGGQLVRFAGVEGGERVTVTMDGLDAQPDGRQYQVWVIRDGKWISLGSCNTNQKGWWRGDFQFTLQRGEEVALTVEPSGGSAKPTSPSLLRTKF